MHTVRIHQYSYQEKLDNDIKATSKTVGLSMLIKDSMPVDRTNNRSNSYQWVIVELPTAPDMLAECSDAQSVASCLHLADYNEELLDLKDQLSAAFWRIVDTQLTSRQREVLRLYANGLTQIEIAKILKVNQSSITKSINGNCDYRNGRKVYGGARKKIARIAAKDTEIQSIFQRMSEIKSEMAW